jgi:hypothetical protein
MLLYVFVQEMSFSLEARLMASLEHEQQVCGQRTGSGWKRMGLECRSWDWGEDWGNRLLINPMRLSLWFLLFYFID